MRDFLEHAIAFFRNEINEFINVFFYLPYDNKIFFFKFAIYDKVPKM